MDPVGRQAEGARVGGGKERPGEREGDSPGLPGSLRLAWDPGRHPEVPLTSGLWGLGPEGGSPQTFFGFNGAQRGAETRRAPGGGPEGLWGARGPWFL